MGHGKCIVTGCTSSHYKEKTKEKSRKLEVDPKKKTHFFSIPKVGLELWKNALSGNKIAVKPGQSVCDKHFSKKDLRWRKVLKGPNGMILGVSADFKMPKLKEGAVPSRRLANNPDEESESDLSISDEDLLRKESVDTESNVEDIFQNFEEIEHFEAYYHLAAEAKLKIPKSTEEISLFDIINGNEKSVALPPVWTRQNLMYNGEKMVVFNQFVPKMENGIIQPCCSKQLLLDKNLQTTIFITRQKLNKENSEIKDIDINSIDDLEYLLKIVHSWRICAGLKIQSNDTKEFSFIHVDKEGVVRSLECSLYIPSLSRSGSCDYCRKSKKTVAQKLARMEKSPSLTRLRLCLTGKQKKKLDEMRREIKTLRRGRARSLVRIKLLKELRVREREEYLRCQKTLDQMLMASSLDANQKLVTKEMLASTKQPPRGRRYSKIWISFCLTLHRKSPSVYKFLKLNNVLPLPATQTLSRFAQQHPTVDQEISLLEAKEMEMDTEDIAEVVYENEIVPSEELPDIEMETEII
ncbi:uncharacterized protein LOC122511511 [Leptopilina heterotoma]|uniref:uncharacterized protein LOC122511511 n=1 Tax=Leptopilina heterotoma TaxID=63436 RepID=UPI001CA8ED56|nr:uncharacterized protein LOC122511511 [Leptopilina heterotoma]